MPPSLQRATSARCPVLARGLLATAVCEGRCAPCHLFNRLPTPRHRSRIRDVLFFLFSLTHTLHTQIGRRISQHSTAPHITAPLQTARQVEVLTIVVTHPARPTPTSLARLSCRTLLLFAARLIDPSFLSRLCRKLVSTPEIGVTSSTLL